MRILHTSDWHLGHTLHGLPRDFEHARFLDWLVETLQRERVDVLLLCGDVFDTANPSARAQQAYYGFLARANRAVPHLQVVVIAGNHDSALRLQAPRAILRTMRVHVVGEARRPDGELCIDQMVVPLSDRGGRVRAWCAAVPFLRPSDLKVDATGDDAGDPLIEGVRRLYSEVLAAAQEKRAPDQALIALGHCYMANTEISVLSERRILGGNQHALPADVFAVEGPPIDYVALGHLHKAQRLGKRDHVRYSGSPIALSMAEGRNRHQVALVDVAERAGDPPAVRQLPIPRVVDLVRVPKRGAEPIEQVVERLAALPLLEEFGEATPRPFLEVSVLVDRPLPDLRAQIEACLVDRAPRLVKLSLEHAHGHRPLGEEIDQQVLQDLSPEQVFRSLYESRHDGAVPQELLSAFHELVDEVGRADPEELRS